jgi:hypothetical protein
MSNQYSARPLPCYPRLKACWGVFAEGGVLLVAGGEDLTCCRKLTSADKSRVIVVLIVVFLVLCGQFISAGG